MKEKIKKKFFVNIKKNNKNKILNNTKKILINK